VWLQASSSIIAQEAYTPTQPPHVGCARKSDGQLPLSLGRGRKIQILEYQEREKTSKFHFRKRNQLQKAKEKPRPAPKSSLRLLTSAELSAATLRGRGPPRPKGGSQETPGHVQPHSLLCESVMSGDLHRPEPCFTGRSLVFPSRSLASQAGAFSFQAGALLHRPEPGFSGRSLASQAGALLHW
jgi:hypothetical protein